VDRSSGGSAGKKHADGPADRADGPVDRADGPAGKKHARSGSEGEAAASSLRKSLLEEPRPREWMAVWVSSGLSTWPLGVEPSDAVRRVKERIEAAHAVPRGKQRLLFSPNLLCARLAELDDEATLAQLQIGAGAVLVLKARGHNTGSTGTGTGTGIRTSVGPSGG